MLSGLSRMNEDREEGFTLVELLVVIVIIGILAAIAVGAFLNQKKKANDAVVRSDLSNVAKQYMSWTVDHTQEDRNKLDAKASLFVLGSNVSLPGKIQWNDVEPKEKMYVSPDTTIEMVTIPHDNYSSAWPRKHETGDFCLVANAPNSTWNYDRVGGTMNSSNYDHLLFYDVKAGGVRTMEELAEQGADNISCYAYLQKFQGGA